MNQLNTAFIAGMAMKCLRPAMRAAAFVSLLLLCSTKNLWAQVTLSADGSGDMYSLIESKGFGVENPDCKHPSFGPHVTAVMDNTLGKYVFVFHSHIVADDDRCTNEDRVRMEIKGGSGSPAAMQHTQGQTAYYRWKFRLDPNFVPGSRFCHIFQIKAIDGDAGAPLMTITPRGGSPEKIQIIHSSGEGSGSLGTVAEANLAPFKGTWVEAYVKYKSSDGSAGTFEITLKRLSDGATLLSYTNNSLDMWREGASYNRPKWGVYRGKSDELRDEQVRFADFCISESSASQCPSDIGSGGGGGGTITVNALQDAYVRDGSNAGTAFGSTDASEMVTKLAPAGQTGNNREAYLSFDISGATGTISSVSLNVFGNTQDSRDANIGVGAYSVASTTWSESTLTWNNKPAASSSPLATATVTDATGRYYTWNVTSYVQGEKTAGHTIVSVALKSLATSQGQQIWHSKETGSNPPQLVITTSSGARIAASPLTVKPTDETAIKTNIGSYPNPFRNVNTITFNLAEAGNTHLVIFDMLGKQVAALANGYFTPGTHQTTLSAGRLPAGLYTIKMIHNGTIYMRKIIKE